MSQELQVRDEYAVTVTSGNATRSVAEVVEQMKALEDLMSKCLKKGNLDRKAGPVNEGDYYTLPGSSKPCLSKAGAQKVAMMFRFAPEYEIYDLSTATESRYRVRCRLTRPDGTFVGEAWGESSSAESKQQWRKALDDAEFEEANADEKRVVKRKTFEGKVYEVKQIIMNRADSTVRGLPVAQKRAYVQAVLAASGASCLFTSDLESVVKPDDGKEEHEPIKQPQAKKEAPSPSVQTTNADHPDIGTVTDIRERKGTSKDPNQVYWFVVIDGHDHATFDADIAAVCQKGITVRYTWKAGKKEGSRNLMTAVPVSETAE